MGCVIDITLGLSDHSSMIRLSLSMYWRVLVVTVAIGLLVVILLEPLQSGSGATLIRLKPTILYASVGLTLLASLAFSGGGLLYLVTGVSLAQSESFWRKFTLALGALLLGLAVTNLLVAYGASVSTWVQYKAFAPAFALLAYCFVATRLFSSQASQEARAHAKV